jgi:hypothetical protein
MKKFLVIVIVLGFAAFQGFKILDRKAEERNARERVSLMFERLKTGVLADEQDAIGYWRVGHPEPASDSSANEFGRFRSQGKLGRIESFTLVSSRLYELNDASQRHVDIVCTVNGRQVKIRAVHGLPLEWID